MEHPVTNHSGKGYKKECVYSIHVCNWVTLSMAVINIANQLYSNKNFK